MLKLKNLSLLDMHVSLCTDSSDSTQIKHPVFKCYKAVRGMKIDQVHLEVRGEPIFLKCKPIPYGLSESVKNELDKVVVKWIIIPVKLSI